MTCLLTDSEFFYLICREIKQILLKISFIPILLTFMYLVELCKKTELETISSQLKLKLKLNSSFWQIIAVQLYNYIRLQTNRNRICVHTVVLWNFPILVCFYKTLPFILLKSLTKGQEISEDFFFLSSNTPKNQQNVYKFLP
jgi:hypothetical protein